MITKHDLDCAIAECQGEPNPNAQTCAKLASYFTIYDHMYKEADVAPSVSYSMDSGIDSKSDFAKAVEGKDIDMVLVVIDELMDTLAVLSPKLYRGVLRRLE